MSTKTAPQKIECLNPNTGGRMNIDKKTYDLFSKAIYHTLKKASNLPTQKLLKAFMIASKNKKQNLTVPFHGIQ